MKFIEAAEHIVFSENNEIWTVPAKQETENGVQFGFLVVEHCENDWCVCKPNLHCVACANEEEAFEEAEWQAANVWTIISEDEKNELLELYLVDNEDGPDEYEIDNED